MQYRVAVASTVPPALPDPRASQWTRRALVGAAVAMAAILVVTAWLSYASARAASRLVARGQAESLLDVIRRELRAIDGPPSVADLETILSGLADRGARYLAMVQPGGPRGADGPDDADEPAGRRPPRGDDRPRRLRGPGAADDAGGPDDAGPPGALDRPVVIAAGTPAGAAPIAMSLPPPRDRRGGPALEVREVGGRLQVIQALPAGRRRGPPPMVVLELESSAAREVAAAARRSLITACAGALLLIISGLAAARWLALRDREALARGRERHLASLGEMSAVLAHELRNPLASLKGNAQLLAEGLDGPTRDRADVVVDEAVRLERLAGGLLDFVRTGALRKRACDPAALVRTAAGEVDGARVEIDAEAAPAQWSLDPDRMHQVLVNVLRNAVEASPDDAPVRARIWQDKGALRVQIRDRGPGIPAGEEQLIFEPFRTGKVRGTGLGLAVARRVVELHGGTIRAARGDDGTGAVIDVQVPR